MEDMTVAERALHDMRTLIRLMQEEVAKAQEKKKEQEQEEERQKQVKLQAQQEAQRAAAQSAKEALKKGERIVLILECMRIIRNSAAVVLSSSSIYDQLMFHALFWAAPKIPCEPDFKPS